MWLILDINVVFCVDKILKCLKLHFVSQTFRLIGSFSSSSSHMLLPGRPLTLPLTKVNKSISLDDLTLVLSLLWDLMKPRPLYISKRPVSWFRVRVRVCFPSAGGESLS